MIDDVGALSTVLCALPSTSMHADVIAELVKKGFLTARRRSYYSASRNPRVWQAFEKRFAGMTDARAGTSTIRKKQGRDFASGKPEAGEPLDTSIGRVVRLAHDAHYSMEHSGRVLTCTRRRRPDFSASRKRTPSRKR